MPGSPGDLALRALARHRHPTGEAATPFAGRRPGPAPHPGKATKTARFLGLVTERHGSLAQLPLDRVAGVAATLAPLADLKPRRRPTTAAVRMVMIADSVANLGKPAPNGGYRCLCELGRLNHGRAIWCQIGHRELDGVLWEEASPCRWRPGGFLDR
jgi:hypothetical protein